MKTKIVYFVKPYEMGYEITMQRDSQEPTICSRFPQANQQNEAIGLALKMAISSKHDYGNKNVRLIISLPVCSIDDPMISI